MPLAVAAGTAATGGDAAACESLAVSVPRQTTQLITVEAARLRTTAASLRLLRREGDCWVRAAGPWTARVGWNGISHNRREGDGTTPAGVFSIGSVMYGTP